MSTDPRAVAEAIAAGILASGMALEGPQGPKGDKGDQGIQGPRGERGPQGIRGDAGDTGADGPAGRDGAPGPEGPSGPQGERGPKGDKGDRGDPGPAGPKGDQGEPGPAGPAGLPGLGGGGARGVKVLDEGAELGTVAEIDFTGTPVTVTRDGRRATVTVTGTGGGGEPGPAGPAGPAGPEGPAGPSEIEVTDGTVDVVATEIRFTTAGTGGGLMRVTFPFAFDTASLDTGVEVYTPAVGDLLVAAWVEVSTAWDQPLKADFGAFDGSGFGLFSGLAAPPTLSNVSQTKGNAILAGSALGIPGGFGGARFTDTTPLVLVVNDTGTDGGTVATPAAQGAATLYLLIAGA